MIIGVTGTSAAGKDTVYEYLKNKGYFHFSLSDEIRLECDKRGLPKDRQTLIPLGNELRQTLGNDILARRVMEKIKKMGLEKKYIITSIRNVDEVVFLKTQPGFILLAVDAPIEMRFQRITTRQSDKDHVDFATFKAQEDKERSGLDYQQNLAAVMAMANHLLINDGSFEDFYKKIDLVLDEIKN